MAENEQINVTAENITEEAVAPKGKRNVKGKNDRYIGRSHGLYGPVHQGQHQRGQCDDHRLYGGLVLLWNAA